MQLGRADMAKPKSPVSRKISKLIKEGVPPKQAVAMALQMKAAKALGPKGGYRRARGARSSGRGQKRR